MSLTILSLLLVSFYPLVHAAPLNVLYLAADDMRADLGPYGVDGNPVKTPNLDKLAAESTIFQRAYCQISVCAPSRMSFMNSRRPDTTQIWNFVDVVPENTISTPRHFRDNGYLTLSLGKLFHQAGTQSEGGLGCFRANESYSQVAGYPCYPYASAQCPNGAQEGGGIIYVYHLRTCQAQI